jgi:uncharacterized membrane protein YfhO
LQRIVPQAQLNAPDLLRLPPVLDLLNVRHLIFRGSPPPDIKPPFVGVDYYLMENSNALARATVPQRVELVTDDAERLRKMTAPEFDPRAVAFVEEQIALPASCSGEAEIVDEIPTRVTVKAKMQTAGLVMLADTWDKGWRAYRNGERIPVLRTDHALRGVIVTAGESTIEFRFEPGVLRLGLGLFAAGAVLLVALTIAIRPEKDQ